MNQKLLNLFEKSKIDNRIDHHLYTKHNVKLDNRNQEF